MKSRVLHIITILAAVLFTGCLSEMDIPAGTQRGSFAIALTADSLMVEVETRAPRDLTDSEAASFLVTLSRNDEPVWERKTFSSITQEDRKQSIGEGYVVSAENVTADEAESSNSGWGCRRYAGASETFSIVSGQITYVTVPCAMANAGLCVTFDHSFTSYFSDYAVTTDDARNLKFNGSNAAQFDAENHLTAGTIAYYNTDANRQHTVDIIISASAGWEGTANLTRTLTLRAGKITRLNVKLNSTEPTEGNIMLSITYEDFEEIAGEEIVLD